MDQIVISGALGIEPQNTDNNDVTDNGEQADGSNDTSKSDECEVPNQGKLQLDATVCDAYIKYPTDLNLLNESREKAEELLDKLIEVLAIKERPRTYRRVARKDYLNLAKKKRKGKNEIRKGIRKQLGYLKRNINYIQNILSNNKYAITVFDKQELLYWETIQELYRQQEQMYRTRTNSIEKRIVSIHQPFIRPIVRGKDGKKVEFGSKINVSLVRGYTRINQFDFEPFNEGTRLQEQVEAYKDFFGFYPELVQTDDIYMSRDNRAYLKERGIRHTGRPLGRKPKKETQNRYQREKSKKEKNERNHIEGKFGQGKAGYDLNKIKARLADTHESWVASIVFVMNILRVMEDIFWQFFKERVFYIYFQIKLTENLFFSHKFVRVA